MSEILFRFLTEQEGDEIVEWIRTPLDEAAVHRGSLSDLARAAAGTRCVLVASGEFLVLATATVPSRQRNTILRAVPYLLEDQLADEIERLHFAVGDRDGDGVVPVVAVRHTTLAEWQRLSVAAGISLHAVVPEPLLIPHWEGEWTVVGDGHRLVVRKERWGGMSVDKTLFPLLLDMRSDDDADKTRTVHVLGGLDVEETTAASERTLEIEDTAAELMPLMAVEYQRARPINLLQGPYGSKAKLGKLARPWIPVLGLMLGLLAAQFGSNLIQRYRLEAEVARLDESIEATYRQAFPDSRNLVNPKLQMERQLSALRKRAGSGAGGLLEFLSRSGPVLRSESGLNLTGLNYRDGSLTLNLSASSLETVDQLRERLVLETELAVDIQSASSRDGKVNSRMLIRKGAT